VHEPRLLTGLDDDLVDEGMRLCRRRAVLAAAAAGAALDVDTRAVRRNHDGRPGSEAGCRHATRRGHQRVAAAPATAPAAALTATAARAGAAGPTAASAASGVATRHDVLLRHVTHEYRGLLAAL